MQEKQITIMLRSFGYHAQLSRLPRVILAVTLALDNPDRLEAVIKEIYRPVPLHAGAAGRRSSAPCARSATAPAGQSPAAVSDGRFIRCGAPLRPPKFLEILTVMPHAILSFRCER